MDSLLHCHQFLLSPPPRVKAWLERQFLSHLKVYDQRIKKLKEGIDNLKKLRYAVQHQINEEVRRYNRGILNLEKVEQWIKKANEAVKKCEAFIQDKDHEFAAFDLLTSGYLPKARIRLRLSKKAFDFIGEVNGLLETTQHDTFSYWLGPPSMADLFENRTYESFPSRDATIKNIKEALESPKVRMIGLHGLSGVGKTTLVKEIIREALQASEAGKLFDVVALANVTRNPDITKVQGLIAETLGMKLEEETDVVRAARIREILKNKKESTLIILDDLWAELDLKMLGIPLEGSDGDGRRNRSNTMKGTPFENVKEVKNTANSAMKSKKLPSESSSVITEETLSYYKGCKVLLISESKEVLLNQMGGKINSIFSVDILNKKEAEAFFNKMSGVGAGSSEFEKLAAQIASKCNGLPMSIVTTARGLKDQSRSVWEDNLLQLERGKFTAADDFSTVLSYKLLENEELKDAFLLCARMGPDALIIDLVKYCIGLGFLQGIYTAKEAWDRVSALVRKLKVSGLLSDSYSSDHFTMSDTVRRAALSIASEEKHVFTMTKGKVDEWPDEDKLERYTSISLHHCDIIDGYPSSINCPKLRVLHVNSNNPQLVIPKNLFHGMKELRALILTNHDLSQFPSSIRCLTKLRMLCLEQCKLDKDLSFISELRNLRILSLSGSDIVKLPIELKHLTKLQIFDISNCSKLREIPSRVISRLVKLEELYMRNTLIQWEVQEHTCESKNASLSELRHLIQLTTLDMQIPNDAHFPKNLFFDKLHSYKIVIGDLSAHSDVDFKIPEKSEALKFLAIQSKDGFDIHSQKGIKMLFERVEHLLLENLKGVKDIFYSLNLKGFPYLKHLLIANNSNIESLITPEDRKHPEKAFPRLESLHLNNLKNVDKICSCELSQPSFHKLKFIKINICGKLKNVFSTSVVSLLILLETIEISECYALEGIVEVKENEKEYEDVEFPELRSLTLQSLHDFIGFYPIPSTSPIPSTRKDLFNGKVIVSKLERMVLSSIHIDKIWSDQLSENSRFQNLIQLDVNSCPNLKYLISLSMAKSLENLQTLFVSECEQMTNIFSQEQGSHAEIEGSIFPNLKNIKLSSMKRLLEIWNSKLPSNSFDKLDSVIIEECDKFVNVFPCHMGGMFQSLCNLRVTNCKSIKAVFVLDDEKSKDGDLTNLRDVYLETLPKLEHVWKWSETKNGILKLKSLQKLWIHDCLSLENVFTVSIAMHLPSLEHLVILSCFGLRNIVAKREDSKTGTSSSKPSFEFPKLTTIKFSSLPQLSSFYPGYCELSCLVLNDLSIEFCYRLELFRKGATYAETKSTLISEEGINQLKCMQIDGWLAESSSSYMGEGSHRRDNLEELCLYGFMNPEIVYSFLHRNPNLKSLTLDSCTFTYIVPLKIPSKHENLGVVPKLKILKLIDLRDLEIIGFEQDILFERIEFLILKYCTRLVNIIPSHVSLTHLTDLEVDSCDSLEKLMPPSAANSLVQLNTMKVMNCESLLEIVDNEEDEAEKVVFSQLKVLELVSLKNLNCFSKSDKMFEFPSLEKLVVSACPKMEFFSKLVKTTPLLQKIFVVHEKEKKICCWEQDIKTSIRQIFEEKKFFEVMDEMSLSEHHDLQQTWHCFDGDLKRSWFYSLKTLKLEGCENLSYAIPIKILPHLKCLKELEVRNCNKVKVIFEKNDTEVTPSQLKNLTLEGLSKLVCVWEKNCNLTFQNLQQVVVINCERLQTLFPAALAKKLEKFEVLEIYSCAKLLEIIGKETNVTETGNETETLVFPCLTWLNLFNLPELTYFYPERFNVKFNELHNLYVVECPKLVLFETDSISNDRKALFSDLMVIRNLEELTVDSEHTLGLKSRVLKFQGNLEFLTTVRLFFDVDHNEVHTLSLDILKRAPNLQDMSIEWCNNLNIECCNNLNISDPGGKTAQLKMLTLNRVTQLQSISFEDSWLNTVCKNLCELIVTDCSGLTKLFHSPTVQSFSNLKNLSISKCHELLYLFTASVVKLLVNLEEISVIECKKISEIIAKEEDGTTTDGVEFKWLYFIQLNSLRSLECFYSGKDILQLESLKVVSMWQCPMMKVFSQGMVVAKSFGGIEAYSNSNDELVFHEDLNFLVERVVLLQKLSEGTLSEHRELEKAWDGGLSPKDNWFYSLRILKLDNCDFMKQYAIPCNVLHCLKNLRELEVRNCDKVQVIFEMNDTVTMETSQLNSLTLEKLPELTLVWRKMNCQEILMFRNLREVSVSGCESMKAILPLTLAKKLTVLEKLVLKSCHKLQEIVGKEDDATIDATEMVLFPRLTSLYLDDLPELTSFYPELFTAVCPKLNDMYCSKMGLFQGTHHEGEGESENSSTSRVIGFSPQDKWFCSLRILILENCDFKQYAIPSNVLHCLTNLRELEVRNCNKVKVIFETNDIETMETSQLNSLTLEGLPELTLVWKMNCQGILMFRNLRQVSVGGCESLKALLPVTLAEKLTVLEELKINSCHKLQEIVGKEDDATADATKKFLFPHLTSLYLDDLPELTSFYPELFTVVCPKLNDLHVMYCSKMELFQGTHRDGEGENSRTSINRQPLFLDFKAMSILEELSLHQKHISVLRLGQCKEDLKQLHKIHLCFDVKENENPTPSLEIFEMPPQIQDMTIECCHRSDVFLPPNPKFSEHELLEQLKMWNMSNVSKLELIGLGDSSWLSTVCGKLQELNVRECSDLTTLFRSTSAASFSNLKEMAITECHGLEYLFTLSTIEKFTHLEKITVKECSSMRTVLAKDEDEAPQGVKFKRLRWIDLNSLSSLDCFYPGNNTLQLPLLFEVEIGKCPKMEVFSRGEINAKSFSGIQASSDSDDELVFHNDLNGSVKRIFLQQEHLVFKDSTLLKSIWLKSETVPDQGFCNLNTLIVEGCDFLLNAILPSHIIPLLSKLKILEVRKCNSVKSIFVYTKIGPEESLSLPNLEKLCVENCDKMVEIVAKDKTDTEEADQEIVEFPKVTFLKLQNLCNLKCIYPGVRILHWPKLKELHVMHCPMLKFFATEFHSSPASVSLKQVTPCLEVLSLGKEEANMIEQGKLQVDLQELKSLVLQCFHDKSDSTPFVFHSKALLPSIKKLVVRHSSFEEIFPPQTSDIDCAKFLSQLVTLELRNLSLPLIGIEHPWMKPYLENLQTLLVRDCGGLKNLAPTTVSFSNLVKLHVKNCCGLKYLFTSATAKTLRVLTKLCISNCKSLIAIVAKEGDELQSDDTIKIEDEGESEEENEDESEDEDESEGTVEVKGGAETEGTDEGEDGILFKKLEILRLGSLPKLGSFYSGTSTLKFPSLKSASFKQCYNMKIFRLVDELPEDLKITIDEERLKGDINSVIMQQFEEERQPADLVS